MDFKKLKIGASILVEAAASTLPKLSNKLTPLNKRQLISELYTRIAQTVLPMPAERISWMQNYISSKMTNTDIEREWGFIVSGKVNKLISMFVKIYDPDFNPPNKEEILENLKNLHSSVAKGLHKYKSTNTEIDRDAYKFVEKIVMDFANSFEHQFLKAPEVKKLIEGSFLVIARNVVNQEEIDEFLKEKIESHSDLSKWIKSNLRNHILNNVEATHYKNKPSSSDPAWLKKAYDSGVELFEVKLSRKFSDEVDHALDWLESQNLTNNSKVTVEQAIKSSKAWTDKLKGVKGKDTAEDSEFVSKLSDGYYVVKLKSEISILREGTKMQHCLKDPKLKWYEKVKNGLILLSLRDKKGEPHATFEVKNGNIHQMKGKQNEAVEPKYIPYVQEFLKKHGAI